MDRGRLGMKISCPPLFSKLLAGSALDPNRKDVHSGPAHPGYGLKPGIMRTLVLAFATGFGTGLSPVASGTTGSVVGLALFWFMGPPACSWMTYIAILILLTVLGILSASAAEGIYGKRDDGRIVIDEVVGYLATMLWAPHTWTAVLLGFVLFRFFDVVKLPPAYRLQSLRGGVGIVLDDVVSGLYSCGVLHIVLFLLGAFGNN